MLRSVFSALEEYKENNPMTPLSKLRIQAISAAKHSRWDEAVQVNSEILEQEATDVQALNRLGLAHLHLEDTTAAKTAFQAVLGIDKHNSIAHKQLERIAKKATHNLPSFSRNHFIEEPGKTKIVELHRLAGKQVLDNLAVGQTCQLKMKQRYISIETEDGKYIGALPEDISFILSKLITTGNTYHCSIQTCSNNQCLVYLKELSRAAKNSDIHSFPLNKQAANQVDIDERLLLDEFEEAGYTSTSEESEGDDEEPAEEPERGRQRRSPEDYDD